MRDSVKKKISQSEIKGDIAVSFGHRLKGIRKSKGMTQTRFGEDIGVAGNYISELEAGKKNPSLLFLKSIEHRYAISLDWLLWEEGPKHIKEVSERPDKLADQTSLVKKIERVLEEEKKSRPGGLEFAEPPGEEYDAEYKKTLAIPETQMLIDKISTLPEDKRKAALEVLYNTAKLMVEKS
jgi:transcriptional regulator with XRE-family HTH domain